MSALTGVAGSSRPSDLPAEEQAGATARLHRDLPRGWVSNRATAAALGGIGLVGAVMRVLFIDRVGFNSDEAVYAGQAASIAGDPAFTPFFPVFRAHPLLTQSLLSLAYRSGVSDVRGRLIVVAFGLATVALVYVLGTYLYGRRCGLVAALLLAVMPYHVVVTRQVLLDGPMVFFATLSLYCLARFAGSGRTAWLAATGGALGLSILAKETSIVLLGAVYAFLALSPRIRVRWRDLAASLAVLVMVVLPFPVSLALSGRTKTGGQFLAWQLFRRPNHGFGFYFSEVPTAVGVLVVVAALGGLWLHRQRSSWRETLLVSWLAAVVLFFSAWPIKGFQYLLPVAPVLAIMAARALTRRPDGLDPAGRAWKLWPKLATAGVAVLVVSLVVPSYGRIRPSTTGTFLAGSGGLPGGREAGRWIAANVPEGARLLTVGPSMANVVQFYGHRRAFGLSVSPNPLHRNPVYEPIPNPDLMMRRGDLQYIVWDSYSAGRSEFFSRKLLGYAERYHGRVVHTQSVTVAGGRGEPVSTPVIVVYEVRP